MGHIAQGVGRAGGAEWVVDQIFRCDSLGGGEGMGRTGDNNCFLRTKYGVVNTGIVGNSHGNHQIGIVIHQFLFPVVGNVADLQIKALGEQHINQTGIGRGNGTGDPDKADRALLPGLQLCQTGVEDRIDLSDGIKKELSVLIELNTSADPIKELESDICLQSSDGSRQGRLRDVELLRSSRHVLRLGHSDEVFQGGNIQSVAPPGKSRMLRFSAVLCILTQDFLRVNCSCAIYRQIYIEK